MSILNITSQTEDISLTVPLYQDVHPRMNPRENLHGNIRNFVPIVFEDLETQMMVGLEDFELQNSNHFFTESDSIQSQEDESQVIMAILTDTVKLMILENGQNQNFQQNHTFCF